ncbi:MAG: hypothetical protein ILA15_03035 [Clostridiales bacterium]|nr:hypothetical protein [Clostridiales bacterium]
MKITAIKDMEDMKMTKTKNFEIDMNKLENVTGGKEIWWCSELEIDRPSLAESRRPQLEIELEFGRPVKPPVVASESILKGRLINPRDW